jgi:hypothetical protein
VQAVNSLHDLWSEKREGDLSFLFSCRVAGDLPMAKLAVRNIGEARR